MESNQQWLGDAADKSVLLEHFRRAFLLNDVPGRLHYAHTYPDEKRSAESLYTLRLCRFEIGDAPLNVHAAFDGILGCKKIGNGDILLGSYNAANRVIDRGRSRCSGGVSVVFHTHHIKLHYCRFEYGKLVENIYYYTPLAAKGALLQMAQALDMLIHDASDDRDERCRPLLEALVRQLYHELTTPGGDEERKTSPLARRIKYYIENNFYRMVNCSDICDELGVNRSYAAKVFNDNFGMTMNEHLLDLRLEAAKNLLLSQRNLRIEEIAWQCAFADAGYFGRIFRKNFGVTPGEFRKQQTHSS